MKVERMVFLPEFLPALWEHRPILMSVVLLTYAAMQQGDDNNTTALLSLVFVNLRSQCGRRGKLVKKAK